MEAPFVYAALDALASRAASWAERRQRRLLESAAPAVAATMQEPEEAATMMAAAVKQVHISEVPGDSSLVSLFHGLSPTIACEAFATEKNMPLYSDKEKTPDLWFAVESPLPPHTLPQRSDCSCI